MCPCVFSYLEGLNLFLLSIPRHSFTIHDGGFDFRCETSLEPLDNIRIFGCVILLVPAVDLDLPALQQMDLGTLPIILPFTGKLTVLKSGEDLLHPLGRAGQHRLQGYTGGLVYTVHSHRQYHPPAGQALPDHRLDTHSRLFSV